MKFELVIEMGNAGMNESRHIAEALRNVAMRVEAVDTYPVSGDGTVMDLNGNTVGRWVIA